MNAQAVDVRPLQELVDAMVTGDSVTRACAYGEILRANYGGALVADVRCGSLEAPIVVTIEQLYRHLIRNDTAVLIQRRGGRMHHAGDVIPWSDEDGGRGPGRAIPR